MYQSHHRRTLIKMCYKCSQSLSLIMEFVRGYFKCIYSFILYKKKIQYSLCLCNFMWSVESVHIFTSVLLLDFLFFFIWFDITSAHTLTPAPPQLCRSGPSVQHFITVFFFFLHVCACTCMWIHCWWTFSTLLVWKPSLFESEQLEGSTAVIGVGTLQFQILSVQVGMKFPPNGQLWNSYTQQEHIARVWLVHNLLVDFCPVKMFWGVFIY